MSDSPNTNSNLDEDIRALQETQGNLKSAAEVKEDFGKTYKMRSTGIVYRTGDAIASISIICLRH